MNKERVQKILKQNEDNWQIMAEEFTKTRKWNWRELEFLSEYIKEDQKVLDLGCGNGRLYQLFQDKNIEYVGIDNSENLIKTARKQFNNLTNKQLNKSTFLVADALNLGTRFPNNEFDIIVSVAFLHHIPSEKLRLKILKDCYSLLKPNGFLVLTVWNLFQWKLIRRYHLYSLFWGRRDVFVPWKAGGKNIKRYHHVFTLSELKRLTKKAGFKIIKCHKDSFRGFNLMVLVQKVC
ncbi:MAG: class I SAM-dependent methyltransferase [Bacteroidales bacterium]|nr:class I SAM-dependent methyltransferase [Bacteroidales bacterium]